MRMGRAVSVVVVLLFRVLASAEGKRLTIDDVVHGALSSHPRLTAVRARAEAARDLAKSAGGRLLPAIVVTDEYQHWDDVFAPAFPIAGPVPAPSIDRKSTRLNSSHQIISYA